MECKLNCNALGVSEHVWTTGKSLSHGDFKLGISHFFHVNAHLFPVSLEFGLMGIPPFEEYVERNDLEWYFLELGRKAKCCLVVN